MASALDAIAAVVSLMEKSGLADELKYRLDERRKKEQKLAGTVAALPYPDPPRKGRTDG